MRIAAVLLTISLISLNTFAANLELLWSIDNKFSMPESAAYDPKRKMVYLSNVNHYKKDNNGFISRVSEDGKELAIKWMTGLHSPTGLAVKEDKLYAVDFDALVIIDLNEEKILQRVEAEDASENPVLNDVALGANGEVFVSGSNSRKIYRLTGGSQKEAKLESWLHSPELLKHANGLLVYGDNLLHGGAIFSAFDLSSKSKVERLSKMGEGVIEVDGITRFGDKAVIVSLIDDARLWLLSEEHGPKPFSHQEVQGIDMHYVPEKQMLFLPRVGNTLSAYRVIVAK
jgi:hypothetical protein